MAKCLQFARPMVRRGASLDANQAGWQLLKECQHVATLQLAADDHLAASVNAMNLESRLGDSPHIHGTDVPVEEVAVGTEITLRPPHRTRRALLTHRAPTLDGDEEPLLRPRMQDAWEWAGIDQRSSSFGSTLIGAAGCGA